MNQRVIFESYGDHRVLKLIEDPQLPCLQPDQVLIQQHAIGVNFIDIYHRTGLYPAPALPSGLGSEGAGVVIAVGDAVDQVQVGDRVVYTGGAIGAYADVYAIEQQRVVKLPDSISFDLAAAVFLKGLTVQYLFRQIRPLNAGDTVLFYAAAGGVGLLACQWAKALGVRLIGVVSSEHKRQIALAHGASDVLVQSDQLVAQVAQLTNGQGCDVVFDSIGQDTWLQSLDCVKTRGLLVSFGNASGAVTGVNLGLLAQKGSIMVTRPRLFDFMLTKAQLQASADELFALLQDGHIVMQHLSRFALSAAGQAHQLLEARQTVGSVVLYPHHHRS